MLLEEIPMQTDFWPLITLTNQIKDTKASNDAIQSDTMLKLRKLLLNNCEL